MLGTVIIKRDPAAIGAVLVALVMLVGNQIGWSIELTGSISAVIMAGVGVIMARNVFGTDQFVAVAVNFIAAAAAVYAAWSGIPISDTLMALIITLVTVALGLFVRNGVTNKLTATGQPRAVGTSTTVVNIA